MILGVYPYKPKKAPWQILWIVKELNFRGKTVWWLQANPETLFSRYHGYSTEYFWKIDDFPSDKYRIRYLSQRPVKRLGLLRKLNKIKARRYKR